MNYQSDFRVVFSFPENKLPEYPWRLELSTPNTAAYNAFMAWFDGTEYHNCLPLEDGTLLITVDNHNLAPGLLSYKLTIDAPDSEFPDGEMNVTTPGDLGIELWYGPSEELSNEELNVIVVTLKSEKGDTGDQGPKGDTPVLTAQSDGTILSDGVVLTDVLKVAAENSDTQTARVEELADNPPKIVEVEGAKYWAFWDEETRQYVVSENRADVGDAVLFSPQTLTPQQQEQARNNIGVNNPYSPSYLEIESPFEYHGTVTIGCMAIDGDIMYFGVFGGGYFAYDYIKQDIVWMSQTRNAPTSGNNKQMVVKDEYLYVIGDGNKRIEKYNKKTGELIASRIDDATVQYGQMYISNINGNIYYHSPITKTLYLLNEEDLTANPSGIYDGVIEAIDDNWIDCICIYVSDNHIIWLDFDFQETYSVDATDVTNISSYAYKRIRCIKNKRFVVVAAGASNSATNYAAIVQNNGANFSNSCTRNLLTIGEIFCSAVDGIRTAEDRSNIVATNGIIGGRNGLIYGDAPLSPMPFTYGSAFNIRNKLYLCYCEGSTLKLRIY